VLIRPRGYETGTHSGTSGHSRARATSGVVSRHTSSNRRSARFGKIPLHTGTRRCLIERERDPPPGREGVGAAVPQREVRTRWRRQSPGATLGLPSRRSMSRRHLLSCCSSISSAVATGWAACCASTESLRSRLLLESDAHTPRGRPIHVAKLEAIWYSRARVTKTDALTLQRYALTRPTRGVHGVSEQSRDRASGESPIGVLGTQRVRRRLTHRARASDCATRRRPQDQPSDRGRALPQLEDGRNHLRNTFAKLGVTSRVEVARAVERADRTP